MGAVARIGQTTHGGIGQPQPFREYALANTLVPHGGLRLQQGGQQSLAYLRPLDEDCLAPEVQATVTALSLGSVEPELQTRGPRVPLGASDELRSVQVHRMPDSASLVGLF